MNERFETHTVQQGETLWQIAQIHNTTVGELDRFNEEIKKKDDGSYDVIKPGQEIRVPSTEKPKQEQQKQYTVIQGDTCYSIAKNNNTSVKEIKECNPGINVEKIKPGDVLILPQKVKETAQLPKIKT
jgi:LysM repeat protein